MTKPIMGMRYKASIIKNIVTHVKNWPEFFFKHITKSKKKMVLRMRDGYSMEIRPYHSEASIIMDIWALKFYNPEGFEIKETDTIIDIGGHIGSFSIYASSMANNGKIYAFEPLKENYAAFKKNISLNKVKNIHLENMAVARKNGIMTLNAFSDNNSGTSSLYELKNSRKIRVKTVNLTDYMQKNKIEKIDFMKIDCEGAEYEILFNLPKRIIDNINKISMEYHDGMTKYSHRDLIKFFKKNGFEVRKSGTYLYATNKRT